MSVITDWGVAKYEDGILYVDLNPLQPLGGGLLTGLCRKDMELQLISR